MARTYENYQLQSEDREVLEALLRSPPAAQSLVPRAKIILLTADGQIPQEVADSLETTVRAVYRWRKRFKDHGVDGLQDQLRPGQPKKISAKTVKEVLRLTVECIPHEATHWSIHLTAKVANITPWQVRQIWQAADLRPHRLQTFKISNDPDLPKRSLMLLVCT